MKRIVRIAESRWEEGSGWSYTNDVLDEYDAVENYDFRGDELLYKLDDMSNLVNWGSYEPHPDYDILYKARLVEVDEDDDDETIIDEYTCWESELAEKYYNED